MRTRSAVAFPALITIRAEQSIDRGESGLHDFAIRLHRATLLCVVLSAATVDVVDFKEERLLFSATRAATSVADKDRCSQSCVVASGIRRIQPVPVSVAEPLPPQSSSGVRAGGAARSRLRPLGPTWTPTKGTVCCASRPSIEPCALPTPRRRSVLSWRILGSRLVLAAVRTDLKLAHGVPRRVVVTTKRPSAFTRFPSEEPHGSP